MKTDAHVDNEATLLAYWLDELDAAEAYEVEQHLFECDACNARLRELLQLRDAIKGALLDGHLGTVVTGGFVERLQDAGLRIREYHVQPGGSVHCTIAPEDDFVISRLHAPLAGVRQVDFEYDDGAAVHRASHIPVDPAGMVNIMLPTLLLKSMGFSTQHMRLISVTPDSERVIGEYTFNHAPWGARPAD